MSLARLVARAQPGRVECSRLRVRRRPPPTHGRHRHRPITSYGFSVKYARLDGHSAGLHNVTDAAHGVGLLGTPVYVRYPHPLQGLVVSIVDARRELVWVPPTGYDGVGLPSTPGAIKERPHSAETARDFRLLTQKAQRTLLSGGMGLTACGMDIGACGCGAVAVA